MKKGLCVLLSVLMLMSVCMTGFAADPNELPELKEKFLDGSSPEVNGLTIDYVWFAPENTAGEKLPLVIYFHGAGQGRKPRSQIEDNNFALWASDEIQQRFGGGAFLLMPRSHEEKGECWSDKYVACAKAMIDAFIAEHESEIDLTRIYVGGFSMGGKMTLKMASSYPSFFAAAFPLCPAYAPSDEQVDALADLPVWLIVSRFDLLAGYYTYSRGFWNKLCEKTNVPEDCRLTLFDRVKYPDGKNTSSNHHVWFALANDLFTYDGGAYPNAVTTDATGREIELTSPDGVVSWLCRYTSDYAGEELAPNGALESKHDWSFVIVGRMFIALFPIIGVGVKTLFTDFKSIV
ncbi:MAG: hypothetical protein IJU96_07880 [Clostridia bacterium]|nr:hypothetical protein [Clostridia bacterium]